MGFEENIIKLVAKESIPFVVIGALSFVEYIPPEILVAETLVGLAFAILYLRCRHLKGWFSDVECWINLFSAITSFFKYAKLPAWLTAIFFGLQYLMSY
jgi:hypothetical protein